MKIARLITSSLIAGCLFVFWISTTQEVAGTELAVRESVETDAVTQENQQTEPPFLLSVDPISLALPFSDSEFKYTISISPTDLAYSVSLSFYTSVYDIGVEFSPTHLIPMTTSTMTLNPCNSIILPNDVWYTMTLNGVGNGYTQTVEVAWMTLDEPYRVYLPTIIRQ